MPVLEFIWYLYSFSQANDEKKTPNEKKEKKKKATVRSIDLPVEAKIKPYTKEDINKMVELEVSFWIFLSLHRTSSVSQGLLKLLAPLVH